MSAPEIAQALGVKLNTVYSRLRAARQAFHALLIQPAPAAAAATSAVLPQVMVALAIGGSLGFAAGVYAARAFWSGTTRPSGVSAPVIDSAPRSEDAMAAPRDATPVSHAATTGSEVAPAAPPGRCRARGRGTKRIRLASARSRRSSMACGGRKSSCIRGARRGRWLGSTSSIGLPSGRCRSRSARRRGRSRSASSALRARAKPMTTRAVLRVRRISGGCAPAAARRFETERPRCTLERLRPKSRRHKRKAAARSTRSEWRL